MRLKGRKIYINVAIANILRFMLILLPSIYLTFIVDIYTLNTLLKRIFVLGYFLIMCALFSYLKRKYVKKKLINWITLLSVIVAGLILIVFQSKFLPTARGGMITLRSGAVGEVWLVEADINGKSIPVSQLEISENSGWEYNEDYGDYVFYPGENKADNHLCVRYFAETLNLRFAANSWSGTVFITDEEGRETVLDLYNEDEQKNQCDFSINNRYTYRTGERTILNIGAFILIWNILLCFSDLLGTKIAQSMRDKASSEYQGQRVKTGESNEDAYSRVLFLLVIAWRITVMCSCRSPYVMFPDSGGYMDYPWSDFFRLNIVGNRTPVYPAFLAVLQMIFGPNMYLYVVPIVQALISLTSLFFFRKSLQALTHNVRIANFVTLLYGLNPDIIVWDSFILTESIAVSLTVLFLYLVVKYIDKPSLKTGIAAIGLTLIMVFERPTFLLFAGLLFAFWILRIFRHKDERKMLCKLCVASICTFGVVFAYACSFEKNFGYLNITDALPRQNLFNVIVRGYYMDSVGSEFTATISEALDNNSGEIWPATYEVLDKYGQAETNRLAREILYKKPLRYAKDTLHYMVNDTKDTFASYYLFTSFCSPSNEKKISTTLMNTVCSILELRIAWLYIFLGLEVVSTVRLRNDKKKFWIHLGMTTFMTLIPLTTYMATCGEYNRTMIHVVPFIYLSIAMAASFLFERYVCLDKPCRQSS